MAIDLIFKHNGAAYQAMAFKTLDAMWEGGLFDHLAGGFARYSTDRRWLVPHFEKMLYDNAQLASIYFDGYMRSGQPGYRVIAEETLDYLLNDMADPGGGIYSSEDADSEGVEGKFYVFTQEEIEKCLGADAKVFMRVYGVTPQGNFEEHNILHRFTGRGGAQLDKEKEKSCKEKLLRYRNQRIRPHRDDKILASWNGLALSAFAKGYRVTNRKIYLNQAHKIADFVMRELWDGSNLYRVYRKGQRHTLGFSEDYAFVANGLIDLYEANHDEQRLYQAQALVECLVSKFYDQELGGFYSNDPQRSDTLFSIKNVYDQAIPSPNSQALKALLRLSRYFNQTTYLQMIEQSFKVCGKWLEQRPRAMLGMLSVLDNYLKPSLEIIMVGDPEHPLIVGALASLNQKYLPQLSLIVGPSGALPHYQGRQGLPNEASIYICEGQTCSIPLSRLEEFNKLIEKY